MIFVTVGTHHQPFPRLLDALAKLDQDQLTVQHGPAPAPPGVARAIPYMGFDEMLRCFHEADIVITHAGVGSILCATREGHTPLVVPRRHNLGEHVDEHQSELTRSLERRGSVIAVWDTAQLPSLIAEIPPRRPRAGSAAEPAFSAKVREALFG